MESSSGFGNHASRIGSRASRAAISTTSFSSDGGPPCNAHVPVASSLNIRLDLDNYLALGCLCLGALVNNTHEECIWDDLERPTGSSLINAPLFSHLQELMNAGWIKLQNLRGTQSQDYLLWRVYILPQDTVYQLIDRQNKKLWYALESLLAADIDVSGETWQGRYNGLGRKFDPWAQCDEGSLFYMFNKLPSPSPVVATVKEKYAREALEDLLDPASVLPGLKTILYPYQRRSAGLMLQRESVDELELDPRLEQRIAPDGSNYYYDARALLFFRQPRYYERCRGGILAETMGLGKTVILLSLILATRHHPPKIPEPYNKLPTTSPKVGSLASMVVSAINRASFPWKVEFDRIRQATGNDMQRCRDRLQQMPASYYIPMEPLRWNRNTVLPPAKKMTLSCTTLIVVPRNLCKQWQSEIKKHVDHDALSVLVMEDVKQPLPPLEELRTYDVILFSRNRFEGEVKDGTDEQGRRIVATPRPLVCQCPYIGATRTRDCHCIRSDELYESPLKHLHFKRLIVDEGHFFSNTNNNSAAVTVANKLITADHRWIVSGTPAKDLIGVEVDVFAAENDHLDGRAAVLSQRRNFDPVEDTVGAIKSLGSLASKFLNIKPWYASEVRRAEWDEYIFRHEGRKRTYSGFSGSLRRTLEAMVIKTQPEDVERDIELPPLGHKVVRLEPSLYDKITSNLFTLVLTANAVTSERTDADYIFHKNSAKARYQLISNLRQSAFFWTGFSETDVTEGVKNSTAYLDKKDTACTSEDRQLLTEMLAWAKTLSESTGWKAISRSHELGLFVDSWPEASAEHWAFDNSRTPLLTGVSQLLDAQKHVNERCGPNGAVDPGEGLAGAGIRSLAPIRYGNAKVDEGDEKKNRKKKKKTKESVLTKAGIPISSLNGEPVLKTKRRPSANGKSNASPVETVNETQRSPAQSLPPKTASPVVIQSVISGSAGQQVEALPSVSEHTVQSSRKRKRAEIEVEPPAVEGPDFAEGSPYLKSRIIGTTSAKLSYLISQISRYHEDEKILVFYEGDNVAYYIAQTLELLHIKHEIYAKSLAANLKSEYVVRFDQEVQDRVLLMDVKQAAFGLNLSSASRIYFVNPVCRPNIEAQAIKRAHRIGQTRKVHVETLVLKGTIEEKMLERAKRMTRSEHLTAKSLEDDGGIREIIQNARLLPIRDEEMVGYGQMAPLREAQQLWGRPGWHESVGLVPPVRPTPRRKRLVVFNDITDPEEESRVVYDDDANTRVAQSSMPMRCTMRTDIAAVLIGQAADDEQRAPSWSPLSNARDDGLQVDPAQSPYRESAIPFTL